MEDITVQELKARFDEGTAPKVIDVRETYEYEADHIDAENVPMQILAMRLPDYMEYRDQELVVCCRSGGRSGQMKMYLQNNGFSKVRNLLGGMLAWKEHIDPDFNV